MHGNKEEILRHVYGDGSVVCWNREYADVETPPMDDPSYQTVVLGVRRCQTSPAEPEHTASITGRYESEPGADSTAALCINQAGDRIAVWWTYTFDRHPTVYRYTGQRNRFFGGVRVYELRDIGSVGDTLARSPDDPDYPPPAGWLTETGVGRVHVKWNDGSTPSRDFRRFSNRATLSEGVMNYVRSLPFAIQPVFASMLAAEHAPPSHRRVSALLGFLVEGDRVAAWDPAAKATAEVSLKDCLQRIFGVEVRSSHDSNLSKSVALLENALRQFPSRDVEPGTRESSYDPRELGLVLPEIMKHSVTIRSAAGVNERRTVHAWLSRIAEFHKEHGVSNEVGTESRNRFDLVAAGESRYTLEGTFVVIGIDVGIPFAKLIDKKVSKIAKKYAGKALSAIAKKLKELRWDWGTTAEEYKKKIEKILFDKVGKWISKVLGTHAGGRVLVGVVRVRAPDGSWEAAYDVVAAIGAMGLGGVKGKVAVGKTTAKGGLFEITATGYLDSSADLRPSSIPGYLTILPGTMAGKREDGNLVFLVEGSGTAGDLKMTFDSVETDASSMDVGVGWGIVEDLDDEDVIHYEFPQMPVVDYSAHYDAGDLVQFQLGSATVTKTGRDFLRLFAADELALLRDPLAHVRIDGFADRVGPRPYNLQLSEMRAKNIEQALRDILGDDLAARVETAAHGEAFLESMAQLFPDETPDESWRRGFVTLNATLVASMGTSDPKGRRDR